MSEQMCPACASKGIDSKLTYQDDSFDHLFGTEIIRFYYCETKGCEYSIDAGELEE